MSNFNHIATDQNWQDETTIYWFENENGEQYGVSDCNGHQTIVDCDGYPVNTSDAVNIHLPSDLIVTEEMTSA